MMSTKKRELNNCRVAPNHSGEKKQNDSPNPAKDKKGAGKSAMRGNKGVPKTNFGRQAWGKGEGEQG